MPRSSYRSAQNRGGFNVARDLFRRRHPAGLSFHFHRDIAEVAKRCHRQQRPTLESFPGRPQLFRKVERRVKGRRLKRYFIGPNHCSQLFGSNQFDFVRAEFFDCEQGFVLPSWPCAWRGADWALRKGYVTTALSMPSMWSIVVCASRSWTGFSAML